MVDVLLATYNGEKYLSQQLDSILNQSYKDIRIIISDDGSSDHSIDIINEFKSRYPEIIDIISSEENNRSATSNFMKLINYAKSEYVMFCDQDDVWYPDKIEKSVNVIKSVENRIGIDKPILVFGRYMVVDENLSQIKPVKNIKQDKLSLNRLIVQNYVTGCLSIINKSLYEKIGNYNDVILMHDWWAALIASALGEVYYFPETLMLYRQHSNNCVGNVDTNSLLFNINKSHRDNAKNAQTKYKQQMELFLERYNLLLSDTSKKIIEEYINLFSKCKIARIFCIIRGRYFKDTIFRVIGQFLYI